MLGIMYLTSTFFWLITRNWKPEDNEFSDVYLYNVANTNKPTVFDLWCIIIWFLHYDIICANMDQEIKINTM